MKPCAILAAAALLVSGCILDLYGGDPRVQIRNSSGFFVRTIGIGNPSDPSWKHDLDPLLKMGKSSEVIDLPVAGDLRMWIQVTDTLGVWDTVMVREQSFDVGEFRLIEVSGLVASNLSTSH